MESVAAHGFTATQIVTNRVPERPSAAVGNRRWQPAVNAATRLPVTIAANFANGPTAANLTTMSRTSAPLAPAIFRGFSNADDHRFRRGQSWLAELRSGCEDKTWRAAEVDRQVRLWFVPAAALAARGFTVTGGLTSTARLVALGWLQGNRKT